MAQHCRTCKAQGISRQSASERVDRLEKHGHIQTRRNGRSRFVELASFDLAVGQVGDATREIVVESRKLAPIANETLRDAQSDRARYDAKLKALEYGERVGQLVPLKGPNGIEAAIAKVVELLLRDLNKPLNWIPNLWTRLASMNARSACCSRRNSENCGWKSLRTLPPSPERPRKQKVRASKSKSKKRKYENINRGIGTLPSVLTQAIKVPVVAPAPALISDLFGDGVFALERSAPDARTYLVSERGSLHAQE